MARSYNYRRRPTVTVNVGETAIGSSQPLRLQSMTNTSTTDTDASVAQVISIADAGADIVRLTAQGVREAINLGEIRRRVRQAGVNVPLVADIHFNSNAAFEAAGQVEKVRINPGNFVDPGRVFKKIEYTDKEYVAELRKIEGRFGPFLDLCREHGTAVRLGVNHGSLSDRIMSRYGDTPAGMVESVMEFLRIAVKKEFFDIVISIKASNVVVMVETVRRLVDAMDAEDMHFPLHLGVTEAGDGEDARVKSAVGIGTLLAEGYGDTIRVSLSEAPEAEVPVARFIADYCDRMSSLVEIRADYTPESASVWADKPTAVVGVEPDAEYDDDRRPDYFIGEFDMSSPHHPIVMTAESENIAADITARVAQMRAEAKRNPVIARVNYDGRSEDEIIMLASLQLGPLVLDGVVDGIMINTNGTMTRAREANLAFAILQAARRRITKTEYIACPGCGRTMFDLQSTLRRVKEATPMLRGLKIAVMGCIVNGPGEMADADYGYVGAGVGKVSLYRGKECIRKSIPTDEAIDALLDLLRADSVL